jgi:hypothetical protein
VTSKITDRDRGFAKVAAAIAGNPRVRVGILADAPKRTDDGGGPMTLLEIAAIHEFGAPEANIPQRSFIRGPIDANIGRIHDAQRTAARQIIGRKVDGKTAVARLGALGQGICQQAISQGIAPPNADATIARKGSSTPLVDTGQLRSAITFAAEVGRRR